jgi:hypothetical protein
MRQKRVLRQDVWYEVRTAINNREPLFSRQEAIKVFCREKHIRFRHEKFRAEPGPGYESDNR